MANGSPLGDFSYATASVPPRYRCGTCEASGVRLWREYQTFLEHQTLACADCAAREQSKNGKSYSVALRADGHACVTTTYDREKEPKLWQIFNGRDEGGDQIGWRIPAVPTEDGQTYWGYTSVPKEGCDWWNALPLRRA